MKRFHLAVTAAATWLIAHLADLGALVGIALAYDGAETVFGTGWARLGLGCLIVTVYGALEIRAGLRPERGGRR